MNLIDVLNTNNFSNIIGIDLMYHDIFEYFKNINISIDDLEYLGGCESSVVFGYKDKVYKFGKVLYLDNSGKPIDLKEYLSYSDSILNINECIELNNCNVYICDRINVLKENDFSILFSLYSKLRDDGYIWNDVKIENIGKDKDGNLKLIDYGELFNLNLMNKYNYNSCLNVHKNFLPEFDTMYKFNKNNYKLYYNNISLYYIISSIVYKYNLDKEMIIAIEEFITFYLSTDINLKLSESIIFSAIEILNEYLGDYKYLYEKYFELKSNNNSFKK